MLARGPGVLVCSATSMNAFASRFSGAFTRKKLLNGCPLSATSVPLYQSVGAILAAAPKPVEAAVAPKSSANG